VTHLRQIMLENYGAATTPSPPSTLTFTRLSISVDTSIVHPISLDPSIFPVSGRVVHAVEAGPEHCDAAVAATAFLLCSGVEARLERCTRRPYPKKVLHLPEILSPKKSHELIDAAEFPFIAFC